MAQNTEHSGGWRDGRWTGNSWLDEPVAWGPHYAGANYQEGCESIAVTLPSFPGWIFQVTFSPAGAAIGFEVSPSLHGEQPPAVTARFLKSLPIGAIQDLARREALRISETFAPYLESSRRWVAVFEEVRRPGRRGRSDHDYASLAAAYVQKVNATSPRPIEDLAAETDYSPARVRNLVYEARRRGLLTKATQGRSGGQLTDKARRLLDDREA